MLISEIGPCCLSSVLSLTPSCRVRIENCIISRHSKIGDKSELKDCESIPGAEIQGNSECITQLSPVADSGCIGSYKGVRLDGSETMRSAPSDV